MTERIILSTSRPTWHMAAESLGAEGSSFQGTTLRCRLEVNLHFGKVSNLLWFLCLIYIYMRFGIKEEK